MRCDWRNLRYFQPHASCVTKEALDTSSGSLRTHHEPALGRFSEFTSYIKSGFRPRPREKVPETAWIMSLTINRGESAQYLCHLSRHWKEDCKRIGRTPTHQLRVSRHSTSSSAVRHWYCAVIGVSHYGSVSPAFSAGGGKAYYSSRHQWSKNRIPPLAPLNLPCGWRRKTRPWRGTSGS